MKKIQEVEASFFRRGIAYIVDMVILYFVVVFPLKSKFEGLDFEFTEFTGEITTKILFVAFEIAVLVVVYFSLLEWKLGQTIGKIIFNIRVKSEEGELTFLNSFLRNLSKFSTLLVLIDSIPLIFKKGNKRFLDKIAKTKVVMNLQ